MAQKMSDKKSIMILHWTRAVIAIFALLVAATHIASAIPSASFTPPTTAATGSGAVTSAPAPTHSGGGGSFGYISLWIDIEIAAYILISVIFLLGLRTWYTAAAIFNAFNLGLYLLSGFVAIPGITSMAFGSRFAALGISLNTTVLMISWVAVLVIGLLLLKYDRGSELDRLLVTHR